MSRDVLLDGLLWIVKLPNPRLPITTWVLMQGRSTPSLSFQKICIVMMRKPQVARDIRKLSSFWRIHFLSLLFYHTPSEFPTTTGKRPDAIIALFPLVWGQGHSNSFPNNSHELALNTVQSVNIVFFNQDEQLRHTLWFTSIFHPIWMSPSEL